jgi:hypothetical protein
MFACRFFREKLSLALHIRVHHFRIVESERNCVEDFRWGKLRISFEDLLHGDPSTIKCVEPTHRHTRINNMWTTAQHTFVHADMRMRN